MHKLCLKYSTEVFCYFLFYLIGIYARYAQFNMHGSYRLAPDATRNDVVKIP